MKKRKRKEESDGGSYFASTKKNIKFISTGCTILNSALGGGYPIGRMVNIVGDKSTGKTLLAIESAANFAKKYPDGEIWYNEVESAFDQDYAAALGMPVDKIVFTEDCFTVEDFYKDIDIICKEERDQPGLYILDSLDALSDAAELDRSFGDNTMGMNKSKKMNELFRRLNQKISKANITLIIISQIRDKINAMPFGKQWTRGGGRGMDFYATHVIFLSHVKTHTRTIRNIKRVTGIQIRAKVEKNKIALPQREAEFPILFGFGVDDLTASCEWLVSIKQFKNVCDKANDKPGVSSYLSGLKDLSDKKYKKELKRVNKAVRKLWKEIEVELLPKRKKY